MSTRVGIHRVIYSVAVLVVLGGGAGYWWYFIDNGSIAAPYRLDIEELRQLADSMPGQKPTALRYEHVFDSEVPQAEAIAGRGWSKMRLGFYSYQVVYPDQTAIIDTAQNKPTFAVSFWDGEAYARVQAALSHASLIIATHEHNDHTGGLADHADLKSLLPALRLTDLQLAHPENFAPGVLDPEAMRGYQPLHYVGAAAVAPGLVLLQASGHSPGSQMIFVKLSNGAEFLLIGDVAWSMDNIDSQRTRPRWTTRTYGEDRAAVLAQIKALHDLKNQLPSVHIVPAHDADVVEALTQVGFLQSGFIH